MLHPAVYPLEGQARSLEFFAGTDHAPTDSLILRLFANDITVDANTVLADFAEASFTGYTPKTIPLEDMSAPYFADDRWWSDLTNPDPALFTASAAGDPIYGWYVEDPVKGVVMFAFKYDTPVAVVNGLEHSVFVTVKAGVAG